MDSPNGSLPDKGTYTGREALFYLAYRDVFDRNETDQPIEVTFRNGRTRAVQPSELVVTNAMDKRRLDHLIYKRQILECSIGVDGRRCFTKQQLDDCLDRLKAGGLAVKRGA